MEIKFRAWHTQENRFVGIDELEEHRDELVYFNGYTDNERHGYGLSVESNVLELQHWTGLLDKNGVEIYEGDIYKNPHGVLGVVEYQLEECSFEIEPINRDSGPLPLLNKDGVLKGEVIGNIYEPHSHLLEQEESK